MQTRLETATLDLDDLERRLERRACWHDDPAAYREGVRDVVAAVRQGAATSPATVVTTTRPTAVAS